MAALTKRKEFEIRMRFEKGEDLKKLALIYKVPLSTINKRKKQSELKGDPWIKGSQTGTAYENFIKTDKEKRKNLREQINVIARKEINAIQKVIDETYSSGMMIDPAVEKAVCLRAKRVEGMLKLRREIEEIPTILEEEALEKMRLDNIMRRLEIQDKQLDLKVKKDETKMLLGYNGDENKEV